ncbi:hypothetical protein BaRGS_00000929 [Batillaria attramentaria]|uniref:Uncharacterized protein n=1 Tax=Batillaria attramentaria TaxID=370345 RepID=A0ABD0M7M3_9CAEN
MAEETSGGLVPHFSVFIDAGIGDFTKAAANCICSSHDRDLQIGELQTMWTTPANRNLVLPLLSVRTGFDLFLRVMNFPPGSEIIMSALNIPDMIQIVRHHSLRIVPLDIRIETAAPKVDLLPQLVSPRTVAIVIAHLYGKWSPMDEIIAFAKERNIYVVEDCAECFCGFERLSHPETDVALFSFGVIKFYTSFGGAIAKVRDRELYTKLVALHETYNMQSSSTYLKKILRYLCMYLVLDVPLIAKTGVKTLRTFNVDYMYHGVKMLRGFPDQLMQKIRERPSGALLATMLHRQKSFSATEFCLQRLKAEYVAARLPRGLDVVGSKASVNNYWLFPVVTENPDNLVFLLNALGVEAYRGATQLNVVEPHNGHPNPLLPAHANNSTTGDKNNSAEQYHSGDSDTFVMSCAGDCPDPAETDRNDCGNQVDFAKEGTGSPQHIPTVNKQYPHEAKYLIDHVVYLPVHKLVPFHQLNRMLRAVKIAVDLHRSSNGPGVKVRFPSKL